MQIADYFISGLWKQQNQITDLMLHVNRENVIQPGQKVSITQVIDLIKKGMIIFALRWNYDRGQWAYIAPLEVRKGAAEGLFCKYSEAGIELENILNLNCIYSEPRHVVPLIRRREPK